MYFSKAQVLALCMLAISRKLLCQERQCSESVASTGLDKPGNTYIPAGSIKHFTCTTEESQTTVEWTINLRGDSFPYGVHDLFLNENGVSIEPNTPSNASVLTLDTTAGENVTTLACRVISNRGGGCFITLRVILFSKNDLLSCTCSSLALCNHNCTFLNRCSCSSS